VCSKSWSKGSKSFFAKGGRDGKMSKRDTLSPVRGVELNWARIAWVVKLVPSSGVMHKSYNLKMHTRRHS